VSVPAPVVTVALDVVELLLVLDTTPVGVSVDVVVVVDPVWSGFSLHWNSPVVQWLGQAPKSYALHGANWPGTTHAPENCPAVIHSQRVPGQPPLSK